MYAAVLDLLNTSPVIIFLIRGMEELQMLRDQPFSISRNQRKRKEERKLEREREKKKMKSTKAGPDSKQLLKQPKGEKIFSHVHS